MSAELTVQAIPANGPATLRIGDGPPLTAEQVRDVLVAGGIEYRRATMTASRLLQGTAAPQIVWRSARDVSHEAEVLELREQRALLLALVRKRLSPLRLRALDALKSWHFALTLGKELGISHQHASNICYALYASGLLERQDAPRHLRGRSPWLYRTVDAVHGTERLDDDLAAIRKALASPEQEPRTPPTFISGSSLLASEQEPRTCECGAPGDAISFDRSICACGWMHYFCQECGTQADPCAPSTEREETP